MPRDTLDEVSDETLLVLYANGDRAAALALTQRVTPRVLAYATRLLGGDRAEAEAAAAGAEMLSSSSEGNGASGCAGHTTHMELKRADGGMQFRWKLRGQL